MEFSWLRPRSAPSLTRAVVKGAGREGQLLLSFGAAFKLRFYCWSLPVLHCSYNCAWFASPALTVTRWFGFLACPPTCPFTAALLGDHWTVSDLIPVSGPGPDLGLLLCIPAPCWCSHCCIAPSWPATTLSSQLLLWGSHPSLPLAILSYSLSPLNRCIHLSNSFTLSIVSWENL